VDWRARYVTSQRRTHHSAYERVHLDDRSDPLPGLPRPTTYVQDGDCTHVSRQLDTEGLRRGLSRLLDCRLL